jgi:hypothetical protein
MIGRLGTRTPTDHNIDCRRWAAPIGKRLEAPCGCARNPLTSDEPLWCARHLSWPACFAAAILPASAFCRSLPSVCCSFGHRKAKSEIKITTTEHPCRQWRSFDQHHHIEIGLFNEQARHQIQRSRRLLVKPPRGRAGVDWQSQNERFIYLIKQIRRDNTRTVNVCNASLQHQTATGAVRRRAGSVR